MQDEPLDEIDLLFSKMDSLEPPVDFAERVMQRARVEGVASRGQAGYLMLLYAAGYTLALVSLAVLAYALGLSIARSGSSALISTLASDFALFADAPSAYLEAIIASVPWLHLLGVALDLAVLGLMTHQLLRGMSDRPAGTGS
jgi:hypothetical protein